MKQYNTTACADFVTPDIYSILLSKPHNPHYLNRYWKFINLCIKSNSILILSDTEKHHICPKAKDLFPEYTTFKEFPWNKVILTIRQHKISHWILYKAYKGSQTSAFWLMQGTISGRLYEKLKLEYIEYQRVNMTSRNILQASNNTHPAQKPINRYRLSKRQLELTILGKHPSQTSTY